MKRKLIGVLLVTSVLILAGFGLWQWGWKNEVEGCATLNKEISVSAHIEAPYSVILLGDPFLMHVTVLYRPERIALLEGSLENLDVSPFYVRSQSQLQTKKGGDCAKAQITYELQALNLIPGTKEFYRVGPMALSYKENELFQQAKFSSDEFRLVSVFGESYPNLQKLDTEMLKQPEGLRVKGMAFTASSAFLFTLVLVVITYLSLKAVRTRRLKKYEGQDELFALIPGWNAISSPDDLQMIYFFLQIKIWEAEEQSIRTELERAFSLLEMAFDPNCSSETAASLKRELEPVLRRIASVLETKVGGRF